MYENVRMTDEPGIPPQNTPARLIQAGRDLFPKLGYAGCSVRALTRKAGVNLGAVTYHFGSKRQLYEEVLATFAEPLRARIAQAAAGEGTPLERIERVVRELFQYLLEEPDMPRILLHQLVSERPMPEVARWALQANHATVAELIREGQRDGSIRPGDPRLLAISVASQPLIAAIMRSVLQEAIAIDPQARDTHSSFVENAVAFIRAGLVAEKEGQ